MTLGRLSLACWLGLLACVSCSDDASSGSGAAGESGAGDEPTAGKPSGGGTTAGSAAEADGGMSLGFAGSQGGSCEGHAETWDAIIAAPLECETDGQCCVVVNPCLGEAQVVRADHFESAQTAWPYCADDCTDCIPPAVIVACDNGRCVGAVDSDSELEGVSHCGDTTPLGDDPGQTFTCQ